MLAGDFGHSPFFVSGPSRKPGKNLMPKLNDKMIRALSIDHGGAELMVSDGGGLYMRVRRGSTGKVWIMRYMIEGKAKKYQIGFFPETSLAIARQKAAALTAKLHQGIDPALERVALVVAKKAAIFRQAERQTVNEVFKRWAEVDLIRHKDGGAEVRRMFGKDVLPLIGDLLAEDVKKGHITGVADALLARGVTRSAKVAFALMRQMFRFAVDRGVIESDPSVSIRKASIGGKDTERDRVLSDDEIKDLFAKMPDARLMVSTEIAVWLALSTCVRIGELLGARWSDVDFERREWTIPDTKNGKPHKVQISDFALKQFERLKAVTGGFEWLYPDRKNVGPVNSKTVTKQLGDRQRVDAPMSCRSMHISALALAGGKWGPHDLRRTGATLMVSLGVIPEVAERCLNHTEQNRVKRTYQRHSYEAEMGGAWQILGERLELLISGRDNVLIGKFDRNRAA